VLDCKKKKMEGVKENMREEKRRKYNRNKDDLIEEK